MPAWGLLVTRSTHIFHRGVLLVVEEPGHLGPGVAARHHALKGAAPSLYHVGSRGRAGDGHHGGQDWSEINTGYCGRCYSDTNGREWRLIYLQSNVIYTNIELASTTNGIVWSLYIAMISKEEVTMSYYFKSTHGSGDNQKFSRESNKTLVENAVSCLRLVDYLIHYKKISKHRYFIPSRSVFVVFAISSGNPLPRTLSCTAELTGWVTLLLEAEQTEILRRWEEIMYPQ